MRKTQTLRDYYECKTGAANVREGRVGSESRDFIIFPRSTYSGRSPLCYRDFYKVSLIVGQGIFRRQDSVQEVVQPTLLISNPSAPYSWETTSAFQAGWHCIFTNNFLHAGNIEPFLQSPLFLPDATSAYGLNSKLVRDLHVVFKRMNLEAEGNYLYKTDVLRSYIQLLLHELNKLQPLNCIAVKRSAATHLTRLFLDLLEANFSKELVTFRTAEDYARSLSVHVNHLNRSLKTVTGKTTTELISERMVTKAIMLLKSSEQSIGEISYALGYEYSTNFNIFFKKHTGKSPSSLRKV